MDEPDTLHNRGKMWLGRVLHLGHAALHAHVGLAIWVVCAVIAGDIAAWWPLAVVFVAEGANEVLDRLRAGSWRIADTLHDIVSSVFWPCVLFGLARGGLI